MLIDKKEAHANDSSFKQAEGSQRPGSHITMSASQAKRAEKDAKGLLAANSNQRNIGPHSRVRAEKDVKELVGATGGQRQFEAWNLAKDTSPTQPCIKFVDSERRGSMSSVMSDLSATNRHLGNLSDSLHAIDSGFRPSTNPLDISRHSQHTIYTLRSQNTVASHGVRSFLGVQGSFALRKKSSCLACALKNLGITKGGLSPFLCTCVVINCISIGYLSLPWAFANAGTVLSTLGFALVMGQSYITALFTLEACARAEALSNLIPTAAQVSTQCLALSQVLPAATLANAALKGDSLVTTNDATTRTNTDHRCTTDDTLFKGDEQNSPRDVTLHTDSCVDEEQATDTPAVDCRHTSEDGPINKEDDFAENDLPACIEECKDSASRLNANSNLAWGDDNFLEEFTQPGPYVTTGSESQARKPAAENFQVQVNIAGGISDSNRIKHVSSDTGALQIIDAQSTKEGVQEESANKDDLHMIEEKKFELSDLCRIFFGRRVSYFFYTTIAFDLYGITWTFATVFASGLSDMFTIVENEDANYKIFILLFASIAVPVTCMDLHDQILVQMTFLIARMVMVLMMLSTTAEAWASGAPRFGDQMAAERDAPAFNVQLLYMTVQIAIFSTAYQFVGPGIADATANKSATRAILWSACLYIFVSTLILSLVLSLYFGPGNIETSSNLNWGAYHGGTGEVGPDGERVGVAMWARMISGFVVTFPGFDALAIFPLLCLSLGEIFVGVWFKNKAIYEKITWKERTVFRLVGCVPQLIGAVFVGDIGVIANYAGLFTVLSYSICPCLLAIYSRRAMEEVSMSPATGYQTMFSSERWAWAICVLAAAFIIYVIVMTALVGSCQP